MMAKVQSCRVCLHTTSNKCISLFDNYKEDVVSEHIKSIAAVEIDADDELPQGICPECLLQLDNALEFKRKCQLSDQLLRSAGLKHELHTDHAIDPNNEYKEFEININVPIGTKDETESVSNDEAFDNTECSYTETFENTECLIPQIVTMSAKGVVQKSNAKGLKCDVCNKIFKTKYKLNAHFKNVHLPDILICQHCKRVFKSQKALDEHFKKKPRSCLVASKVKIEGLGKNRIFNCTYCSYTSKCIENMDAHLATHTGERRFLCNICGKSYTQFSSLASHKEIVHKDVKYHITCHICGKQFSGRHNADAHMRSHRESKKKQCTVCNKVIKSGQCFNKHMIRHSGVKAHSCEICGADFYTSSELITHKKKTHLKLDNYFKYKCELCDYKSYYRSILVKHSAKHTNTNIPCPICGHFFDDAEKYAKHKKRHDECKYPCPLCDKKYASSKSRSSHVREKHGTTVTKKKEAKSVTDLKEEKVE